MAGDSEEEGGTRTSKESSLTSSDGISHPQQQPLNCDMNNAALATGPSMSQSKQHETSSLCSAPAFGTDQSIFPMELLPQTRVFKPVDHHGQHMMASSMALNPQQNVIVPIIKPSIIVNPHEEETNSSCHQNSNAPPNFFFQSPSGPQVPTETFPPSSASQLADKQRHYQQMTGMNSCGPQQAEGYHNFLVPTMPDPQVPAEQNRPSPKPYTIHQIFNWFAAQLQEKGTQETTPTAATTTTPTPTTNPRRCTNSLYDPKYEEMGLPVDPHLRLFLASMKRTNAAGSETASPN